MGNIKMTVLEKSEKARAYYEGYSSKTLVSGFEKFVCTDGNICMFVNSDYEPIGEEVVFKCDTRRFNIGVQLYKPRNEKS